jgi:hypothetical protein
VATKKKADPDKPQTVKLDTRGQLSIRLDTDYVLRPSEEAIMEAERETGLSLYDLASLAANSRMRLDQMGIVTAAFMRAHGKANPDDPLKSSYVGAKPERLSSLIYEAGIPRIMGGLAVLLAGAINGGYTASGEPKPAS